MKLTYIKYIAECVCYAVFIVVEGYVVGYLFQVRGGVFHCDTGSGVFYHVCVVVCVTEGGYIFTGQTEVFC